jgi:acetyl esterase
MIDPQAKDVLDDLARDATPMPADQAAWLAGYRGQLDGIVAMQPPAPAITVLEDTVVCDGAPLGLRLYQPEGSVLRPTLLFIHGGGFVAGSLAGYDRPLRTLALRSGWQVAAIDYRLAPEHPFPVAPDDCTAALRHLLANAQVDRTRLAVGGDSAGGLLATVVARRAREAGIGLALQVLLYPNADLRETTAYASRAAHDGKVVRIDELYRGLDLYLGATDRRLADVSPVLAPDLAGLCPALLVTNEDDPLRDEAEVYGARLREAGVRLEMLRLPGMIHSVMQRAARIDAGDALITMVAERLRALVQRA